MSSLRERVEGLLGDLAAMELTEDRNTEAGRAVGAVVNDVRVMLAAALVAEGQEPTDQRLDKLREYVDWHGAIHDGGCPADDTCDCKWKSVNDGVNSLLAAAPSLHGPFTEQERAVISDLAKRLDISEHKVLVQGLRTYQLIVMGAYKLEEIDPELSKAAAPSLHKEGAGGEPRLIAGTSSMEREAAASVALDTGEGGTRRACNNPDCDNDWPCPIHAASPAGRAEQEQKP